MGVVEFPDGLQTIGSDAFSNCRSLEGLIIPESIENIQSNAFNECYGIGSIVCKGEVPPRVSDNSFNGVAKDNFTLEVPESAIAQYQAAPDGATSSALPPIMNWYAVRLRYAH